MDECQPLPLAAVHGILDDVGVVQQVFRDAGTQGGDGVHAVAAQVEIESNI